MPTRSEGRGRKNGQGEFRIENPCEKALLQLLFLAGSFPILQRCKVLLANFTWRVTEK